MSKTTIDNLITVVGIGLNVFSVVAIASSVAAAPTALAAASCVAGVVMCTGAAIGLTIVLCSDLAEESK